MVHPEDMDLIYEIDEKGDRILVRSIHSNQRVRLRFTNKTSRPVNVWWRNFEGRKQLYVRIRPGSHFNIDSFVTHPWEFSDANTREQYVINNKYFFRPPEVLGRTGYRTNWNITTTVRTLRTWSLLAVARHYESPYAAHRLGLPNIIANDLQEVMTLMTQIEAQQARLV